VLFFWHALGNQLLTLMSNMANDLNLTAMETCYKAVRGDILKSLRLTSDRFGFEPEITARLAQGVPGSTRFPSATTDAHMPKERTSAGGTASRRSG
jgi:hypothetical protein